MALDVGDRRIGIALSDEEGRIAFPRETLERRGREADVARIVELAETEGVEEILVGMPLDLDGGEGPQARKVLAFLHALREKTTIPVTAWDERLTTVTARRVLLDADVSRAGRKRVVDKLAAAILLQGYLDYRSQRETSDAGRL